MADLCCQNKIIHIFVTRFSRNLHKMFFCLKRHHLFGGVFFIPLIQTKTMLIATKISLYYFHENSLVLVVQFSESENLHRFEYFLN